SILDQAQLGIADLSKYNVFILPLGRYSWKESETKKLQDWIRAGGKVVAIDAALNFYEDKDGFGLSKYLNEEEKKAQEKMDEDIASSERTAAYQERERLDISNYAAGAIFKVQMDTTHALGFGTGGKFYALKN